MTQFIIGLLLAAAGAGYMEDPNVNFWVGILFLYGGVALLCYATVQLARKSP